MFIVAMHLKYGLKQFQIDKLKWAEKLDLSGKKREMLQFWTKLV